MGGCCCYPKNTELIPAQGHNQSVSEEHVPLSPNHGDAPPAVSAAGPAVDTNLDTSSPNTYTPDLAPGPSNVPLGVTQTPPVAQEICGDKTNTSLQSTNPNSTQEAEHEVPTALEIDSEVDSEIELPEILEEEEDGCPICLEEFDAENPEFPTNCDHHFHRACILDWMQRRGTCPMCNQDVVFNPPFD